MPERTLSEAPSFSYHVIDLDCPNCARNLQQAVLRLTCVKDARLIYATATLDVVVVQGGDLSEAKREVLATVRSCGCDLELDEDEKTTLSAERSWLSENRQRILMFLSGTALLAGLIIDHLLGSESRAIPCYVVAALSGLIYVAPMAIASLRRRSADMNVLMSIAVIGALIIGFAGDSSVFADAAIVIFLDQIGEWLEGWSMRKTTSSIRALCDLAPSISHVVTEEGAITEVLTSGVSEGDTIRVLPGERVPLDGVIVVGASSFNEAPVTGESVPRDKVVGEEVYAGSLNTNAVVDVRVTADEDCTTLARIVSQVQGAQAEKAPMEGFVDRFAAIYTPFVVAGAIVLGLGIPLLTCLVRGGFVAEVWHEWLYRACSLLVVACPCALVISTPVSFVSALNCAARMGVLVKGGAYFDIATKVTHIAFDKTGTLTTGHPQVTEVVALGGGDESELLSVAAALEESSTHPLARAVVEGAHQRGVARLATWDVEEVSAAGMRGIVAGRRCAVGKRSFALLEARDMEELDSEARRLGETGATALVVVADSEVLGIIGVADTLRDNVPAVITSLTHGRPAREVEMLTGDNAHTAQEMARRAGISLVSSELLPGEKLERIGELQRSGALVAMVGDGINDAPALAKADLGVTMGAAASDTALEVADVALLSDNLERLPEFFALSGRTMNILRENIAFSIGVKLLVFVLVVLGVAGMGAAVFADTGVALIVVLNGMRLMLPSRLSW